MYISDEQIDAYIEGGQKVRGLVAREKIEARFKGFSFEELGLGPDSSNHPLIFFELPKYMQFNLLRWVTLLDKKGPRMFEDTCYGLKHTFSRSIKRFTNVRYSDNEDPNFEDDFYIHSGAMKGALLIAGFREKDKFQLNWEFELSYPSLSILNASQGPIDVAYLKPRRRTFRSWLISKYYGEDSNLGDLAQDVSTDLAFPISGGRKRIREYIESRTSDEDVLATFEEAYDKYLNK